MKTSRQILNMSPRDLRRLVAHQQVEIAQHEKAWTSNRYENDSRERNINLVESKQVKRDVYEATKEPK